MALDPARVALVVAVHPDANESVATGYFVGPDLVLTVHHVVESPADELRVRVDAAGLTEAERWSPATVVWRGAPGVDALLLHTSWRHAEWATVPLARSVDRGEWETWGYARLGVDDESGQSRAYPVDGKMALSGGEGPAIIVLHTEQHVRDRWETHWSGISGSPVFTRPGGELAGLVTDALRSSQNALEGLPSSRLLDDITFRTALRPSFLGHLPEQPWCLVLTAERHRGATLVGKVAGVLAGHRDMDLRFADLAEQPVELPVVDAVASVEHWAAAVEAVARADYVIADVTGFEPAVMLLLGVRSVLRRGVTISATRGGGAEGGEAPFNVRETRVYEYGRPQFYDELHQAMTDGADSLEDDPNYLDLPAYSGVRAPRPARWADKNATTALMLCPFDPDYARLFSDLRPIVQGWTRNLMPVRLLDLTSPRLVGHALYEQIRWSRWCIVDWTRWRANVFFEFGVRLAASEFDPLCIVGASDAADHPDRLHQHELLLRLFEPDRYDPADPLESLQPALKMWRGGGRPAGGIGRVPPGATHTVAEQAFVWADDPHLVPPHVEQREVTERILGPDQEQRPEGLTLFSRNEDYAAALAGAVDERWIASWLYLQHLHDGAPDDERLLAELVVVGRLTSHALRPSQDPRHIALRREIGTFLRGQRAARRRKGPGT